MIVGKFWNGSGLGNMLFRYITVRSLALDKDCDFGMMYVDDGSGKYPGFKGDTFMNIDWGKSVNGITNPQSYEEKKVVVDGVDVRSYDPEINFVKDNTIIDGEFQDIRYWGHHLGNIHKWLKVELLVAPDDTCVIGFRGGEYYAVPDLGLPKEYFDKAIEMMKENGITKFEVHTDDVELAKQFFPEYECIHDIGRNWRAMRYAKNAIIANSSFYIIPRLLNGGFTIAPRGWARYNWNDGGWYLPQNYYPQFKYIHHESDIS